MTERMVSPGANSEFCVTSLKRVPLRIATFPLSGLNAAVKNSEQRGFARAIRADQSDAVAFRDGERNILKSGATPNLLDSPWALMIGANRSILWCASGGRGRVLETPDTKRPLPGSLSFRYSGGTSAAADPDTE